MILPRASLHPLLSSFLKKKSLNSEGNCEAEVRLSLPLVWWDFGMLGSPLTGSAPRGLPTLTMDDGQPRRQQWSVLNIRWHKRVSFCSQEHWNRWAITSRDFLFFQRNSPLFSSFPAAFWSASVYKLTWFRLSLHLFCLILICFKIRHNPALAVVVFTEQPKGSKTG